MGVIADALGQRTHLAELFDRRLDPLEITDGEYTELVPGGPRGYCDYYRQTFGPVVAIFESLKDQPERADALDAAFLEFASHHNRGTAGGPAELVYEYLTVVGTRA